MLGLQILGIPAATMHGSLMFDLPHTGVSFQGVTFRNIECIFEFCVNVESQPL
jgi:hypothetical protein